MRALKTFLRNRKAEMLGCGPCECRTLQCWRYANENCGCGESKSSLPNYVRIDNQTIYLFNEDEEQNNVIWFEFDTDTEGGGWTLWTGEFLIIEDEDTRALWSRTWDSMEPEVAQKLFGWEQDKEGIGHFTSEAMAQFNALINNPTEAQAQILKDWLEDKASDESPIVIFDE